MIDLCFPNLKYDARRTYCIWKINITGMNRTELRTYI